MDDRLRPGLALLISALVHVVVAFVLVGQANRSASIRSSAAQPGQALTVSLVSAARPAARADASAPAKAPGKARAEAAQPESGGANPPERHYFAASEMTQQAVVAEGLLPGGWLIVPGLEPQAVSLQVWISDEGMVERVELETPMSEEDQRMLLAAFATVRFHPARIGRIAVHSRLSLKILVDYTLRA
jgi:hypothetical protein